MNLKRFVMSAIIIGMTSSSVYAADVTIPGADASIPTTAYRENLVDEKAIKKLEEESLDVLTRMTRNKTDILSLLETVHRMSENVKATNYSSSIFMLEDKDRSIKFTIPVNSINGMVMPFGKNYSQYITTTKGILNAKGNIGIEVSEIEDPSIWETSGKPYDQLTQQDMREAFTKHNPNPADSFVDGGKFSYPGITNGTWDVAKASTEKGFDTISTINFSLESQPKYMYHIGIINPNKKADYTKDLRVLANYTVPSITSHTKPDQSLYSQETIGNFTFSIPADMVLEKESYNEDTQETLKTFSSGRPKVIVMQKPLTGKETVSNLFDIYLTRVLSMSTFSTKDTSNYYTVWHNGTPGFLIDTKGHGDKPSVMHYVTHNTKSVLFTSLLYDPETLSLDHDDIISIMTNVSVTPADPTASVISNVLPAIKL